MFQTTMRKHIKQILYCLCLATSLYAEEHENLSEHLIISIANRTGETCILENLNLHDCAITRDAPPSLIPHDRERSFWISDHAYGFLSRKNEATLTYKCGEYQFTIQALQTSCNSKPQGQIKSKNSNHLQIAYKSISGHCANGSPGLIMWYIEANKPVAKPLPIQPVPLPQPRTEVKPQTSEQDTETTTALAHKDKKENNGRTSTSPSSATPSTPSESSTN